MVVALCDMRWGNSETTKFIVIQHVQLLSFLVADLHMLEYVAALSEDAF
jgi:hypothetical protein